LVVSGSESTTLHRALPSWSVNKCDLAADIFVLDMCPILRVFIAAQLAWSAQNLELRVISRSSTTTVTPANRCGAFPNRKNAGTER